MKRSFLISVILLLVIFTGCAQDSGIDENVSSIVDFDYIENEEGGLTITEYLGTAENIVIPTKILEKVVTQIGRGAFCQNRTIVSVVIPDSVTAIDVIAFEDCTSLAAVTLSQRINSIAPTVFKNCTNLSEITLPNTLTTLGNSAFENCTSLKHINIPKSLTTWGENTFMFSGLETIDFEEGLEMIGTNAFAYTNIKTVVLPKSVRELSRGAFAVCANLESVTLNEGLTTIGGSALCGKSKLTEIVIPASVTKMDETIFDGCDTLQAVKFEGDAPEEYLYKYPELLTGATNYTIYYHQGATGFTSPQWCGYPTELW